MSVSLYLGLPGDGKSMSGVRKLVAVLSGGRRTVVTNLPIEVGELETYLRQEYGKDFDCRSRLVLLSQEQVRKFWLVRGDGWRLIDIEEKSYGLNEFPSLQTVYRWLPSSRAKRQPLESLFSVQVEQLISSGDVETGDAGTLGLSSLYVIDEAQNFWPARSFQTTPKGLLFYLSQHRHAGDECVFITQKEAQVEKTVRNLVLEFWVYRNLGQRRRMGFKLPGLFGYACYDQPPSTQGAQFIGCGTFKMDTAGLANCYRTADGVGVGGPSMVADVGRRRSGLNWKWIAVPIAIIIGLAYLVPGWITGTVKYVLMGSQQNEIVTNQVVQNVLPPGNSSTNSAPIIPPAPVLTVVTQQVRVVERTAPAVPERWTNNPGISAALRSPDGWFIVLSDGRELAPLDIYRVRGGDSGLVGIQLGKNEPWLMWAKKEPDSKRAGR